MNINVQGLPLLAVQNTFLPKGGPRAIPLLLEFTANALDFTMIVADLYQSGPGYPNLGGLQTLWIDNSSNGGALVVLISGSGQELTIKAGAQGYFPIISPKNGTITFTGEANNTAKVILLNFPCSAAEWASN